MKALHVVHQSLPAWVGGVEVYTHDLAKAMLERGHAVEVFVREDGADGLRLQEFEGVRIQRFCGPPRSEARRWLATLGDATTEAAFDQVLAQFRPDVVHFQHLLGLPATLVARVAHRRLPIVITLHDYGFICANTKLLTNYNERVCAGPRAGINCGWCGLARAGAAWAAPLAPALAPVFALRHHRLWQALLSADVLIAPTGFVRDTFLRHGAPGEKLHVLDYGIRPPPVAPPPLRSAGPLHVVYLGGIARLKGVHVLVEAFNALPPDAQLRIAGDLDRQPDYSRELRQRARHPGVQFLGQQGRAELWNLLAWADVVAVPSIWYEVSPLVMHEAFAMRRPIIASRHGSLAGWVRDGVDGVLAPPGDSRAWGEALNALAHQRDRLTQLQQAIRPVKTAGAHAAELETLYHRCLDRNL